MSCIDRSADDDVVVVVQVGLLAFVQTKEVKGGMLSECSLMVSQIVFVVPYLEE